VKALSGRATSVGDAPQLILPARGEMCMTQVTWPLWFRINGTLATAKNRAGEQRPRVRKSEAQVPGEN